MLQTKNLIIVTFEQIFIPFQKKSHSNFLQSFIGKKESFDIREKKE